MIYIVYYIYITYVIMLQKCWFLYIYIIIYVYIFCVNVFPFMIRIIHIGGSPPPHGYKYILRLPLKSLQYNIL